MRCEKCHGTGKVKEHRINPAGPVVHTLASALAQIKLMHDAIRIVPCEECGGSGVAHCCDGLTACNDAKDS